MFRLSARALGRLFSTAAGGLIVLLGMLSAAPALAAVGNWSAPVNLSAIGNNSESPQVALDGSGNAIAVWSRFDGSNLIIQSSRSADGGVSWSSPVDLSAVGHDSYVPQVAVDGSGNAVAVWRSEEDSDSIVQSSRSVDGGVSWSSPVDLSAAGLSASNPRIAVDGSGNAVAVWRHSFGTDSIVQSSRSVDGGVSWSSPVDLSAVGRGAFDPQVAVDGSGNAVAVWYRSNGSNDIVQSSRSTSGGVSWSSPVDLSVVGNDASDPQVAVDGSGNTVAVWRRSNGSNLIIQSSGSVDGGASWSSPVDLSASGQNAFDPQVAVDGSDNAVAVWRRFNGSNLIIQSSRSVDGGVSWSSPVDLSASGQGAFDPQVSVDGSGNAVAVWDRSNGSNNIVQSSRSDDGGVSWSSPVGLSVDGQDAAHPQVAVDGSGNAVTVWYRSDGSRDIIQSSAYSGAGGGGGGGGGEDLANTGPGDFVNAATLVASLGLLALGLLARVFLRRRTYYRV